MKECPACKLCFPDDVSSCPNDGDQTIHSIIGEPIIDSRYQLIKRLGQGGMGVVYKARHSYLKTAHAVKVILPDLVGNDPNLVTRFRQEALAAAAIRHHNIVSVTDFGVVAGKMPFLVMEFVEGESLHDMLAREKRLAPPKALEILSAICSGLAAAHKQQIVHRDLKPLNIMLVRGTPISEAVKILDFGLAKIRSGELLGSFVQAQTTGLMGSPYYMAPEQWSDDEPDVRADVYSLGVILYQMLAGDVPFKGNSIPSIMRKHLTDPPPPFTEFGLNLAPSIEEAVRHALEKNPARRTASVEELTYEFREALRNQFDISVPSFALDETVFEARAESIPGGATSTSSLYVANGEPGTALRIKTNPPGSLIFLNGEKLGVSEANGWLVAENIRRGKHRLRVVKDGHAAFETEVVCESDVCHTSAQLENLAATNLPSQNLSGSLPRNQVPQETVASPEQLKKESIGGNANLAATEIPVQYSSGNVQPVEQRDSQQIGVKSYPEARREGVNTDPGVIPSSTIKSLNDAPLINQSMPRVQDEPRPRPGINIPVLAAAFIVGLLLVAGSGFAVYRFMFAPAAPVQQRTGNPQTANPPSQDAPNKPAATDALKPEMVSIPGGTFMMGVDKGQAVAQPANKVTVQDFQMSKFEITNEQYEQFVKETGHRPPGTWLNNRYLPEEAKLPVAAVSQEDAIAYAEWLSAREKAQYALPTEAQWEYAARNGEAGNLYPWGNNWEDGRAVMDALAPKQVGSAPNGANKWGVQDLIGNVWEWTRSPLEPYPGSVKLDNKKPGMVIRGGAFPDKSKRQGDPINSVFRNQFEPTSRANQIGFRVVIN